MSAGRTGRRVEKTAEPPRRHERQQARGHGQALLPRGWGWGGVGGRGVILTFSIGVAKLEKSDGNLVACWEAIINFAENFAVVNPEKTGISLTRRL